MHINQPKILAFAGSTRQDSYNKKLVRLASVAAQKAGAIVTLIDLQNFPMPLYDGDLEQQQGLPESAKNLKQLLSEHHGLMIATPEYNSSLTGVLKNTLDWATRSENKGPSLEDFKGKTAILMSASPGYLGGLRSLLTLRNVLENINVLVLPQYAFLPRAHTAFDERDQLKEAAKQAEVDNLGKLLTDHLKKTNNLS